MSGAPGNRVANTAAKVDLDLLALDEDERAFLLRSIDDLDLELAAGDISAEDHARLHTDYLARLADVQRRIEGDTSTLRVGIAAKRSTRSRLIPIGAGLATFAFALGAGLLVARNAGERKAGQTITGEVEQNPRTAKIAELMQQANDAAQTDPVAAIAAYDEVTKIEPQVVAAWAYGAWTLRLASLGVTDDAQRESLQSGVLRRLDEAVKRDPTYPDALAFRAIHKYRDLGDEVGAKADLVALEKLSPEPMIDQLTASLRAELGLPALTPTSSVPPL